MFAPDVLDPAVAFLARLAGASPALEFAVGTGRVAVPLSARGVPVVWNSIDNLRTQDEQVLCFANAARHLSPGGRFVVELWVPGIRRFPPGQAAVPFEVNERHVGIDTYDMATQQGTSHHYRRLADGTTTYGASNFR